MKYITETLPVDSYNEANDNLYDIFNLPNIAVIWKVKITDSFLLLFPN